MASETPSYVYKVILSNLWLFDWLIEIAASYDAVAVATLRTTSAATIVEGGTKSNVLPSSAKAIIDHRIVPGDTVESVLQHDIDVINDPRVSVKPMFVSFF